MTAIKATLKWSETEPVVEISTAQELSYQLDKISEVCDANIPLIATIYVHGCEIGIGLGSALSFVHVENLTKKEYYFLTVGSHDLEGVTTFFLHGDHHTEISKRNLIPILRACEVATEFFETGQLSSKVEWEHV